MRAICTKVCRANTGGLSRAPEPRLAATFEGRMAALTVLADVWSNHYTAVRDLCSRFPKLLYFGPRGRLTSNHERGQPQTAPLGFGWPELGWPYVSDPKQLPGFPSTPDSWRGDADAERGVTGSRCVKRRWQMPARRRDVACNRHSPQAGRNRQRTTSSTRTPSS